MKRKIISSLALVLIIAFSIAPAASASTQASEYLSSYSAYIYPEGNGDISIWFDVRGTGIMDEIGALSIRLQNNSSGSWTTIKTYSYVNYPNMLEYDERYCVSSVDYSGVAGYSYRAEITVWAGIDGDGDSRVILTDAVIA